MPLLSRLQYKYDLRNTDKRRITSLAWAALELNLEVFEWLLLDYGHDDHELSRDGAHNTIFHLLAAAPAPPALSPNAEIWAGAPDFPPRPQTRPQAELTDVCLRMTEVYYTLFPFLLDWSNNRGETALHVAAQADNPAFIACLIELGADPNLADLDGNTPLHCAASWGHVSCIRALLDGGASVALRNFENFTPADVAYSNSVRSAFDHMARDVVELRRQRKMQQQQREELDDYDGADEEEDQDRFDANQRYDPRFDRYGSGDRRPSEGAMERTESERGFGRRESISGRRERAERQYGDLDRLERMEPLPSPRSPRGGRFRSGSESTTSHTGSRSSSHSYSDHPLPPLPNEAQPPLPPLPDMSRYARYSRPGSPTPIPSRQGSQGHVPQLATPDQREPEYPFGGAGREYQGSGGGGGATPYNSGAYNGGAYNSGSGGAYNGNGLQRPIPPKPVRSPSLPTPPSYSPHPNSGPNSPLPLPQFPGMRRPNSAQSGRGPI